MRLSATLRRAAQLAPRGIATDCDGRRRTWPETLSRVARLAGALEGAGVRPGDRVAMLALNSDRYLEWFFACAWAGAVFVPINTRLAPAEIEHWLSDSGSETLFVDDAFLKVRAENAGRMGQVRRLVHVGDGPAPEGMESYEGLIEAGPEIAPKDEGGGELAGLFYTGGTTGRSKGVMLSHRNLLVNAMQFGPACGYSDRTVYLHAAPMFHLANGAGMFATAAATGTSVMLPAFEPVAVLEAIATRGVNTVLLVPTMVNMLVNHPRAAEFDLSGLERVFYGASPMPEAVLRRALELAPNALFHQAYGQTEASPVLTINPPERHVFEGPMAGKAGAAGRAVLGVDLAILDETDREVPRGEVGQICARGENVMLGYWKRPELTAETLRNGWLHTGDGGRMDEEGFVFVVDRMKDMIISGGENVYSAEVENAVQLHPAVAECAVIGVPDEKWGERVHAIVRLKDGMSLDAEGLYAHCHDLIAGYKCPRSAEFVTDPLPLSGAGKILKSELRRPYWEDRGKAVN